MIDPAIRATIGDLIAHLEKFPEDTPVTLICHEDDGHHIDYEDATKLDIKAIELDPNGSLCIGIE